MTTATPTTPCRAPVEKLGRCVICQQIVVSRIICALHWHRPLCGCEHAYSAEYAAMLAALDAQHSGYPHPPLTPCMGGNAPTAEQGMLLGTDPELQEAPDE